MCANVRSPADPDERVRNECENPKNSYFFGGERSSEAGAPSGQPAN